MEYGATHRMLLRALLARGVLSVREAEQLVERHAGGDAYDLRDLVKAINDQIRPFKQNIKLTTDEVTEEQVLVFLSLGFDDITKSQNLFSATELEYFRVLIEEIITTERRQVTSIAALNLVSRLKVVLSKHDAERHLSTWCDMHYLNKTEDAYSLGTRAVLEFEGYMRRNMPDTVAECTLCKQIVFRGCNCPLCGVAVHTRCLNKYLEKQQRWPCCKAEYAGLPDLTIDMSQAQAGAFASQASPPPPPPPHSPDATAATQDADEDSPDDLTQVSQLAISQSSAVRRRKRLRE